MVIYSLVHSFNKHLSNIYCIPITLLGIGIIGEDDIDIVLLGWVLSFLWG